MLIAALILGAAILLITVTSASRSRATTGLIAALLVAWMSIAGLGYFFDGNLADLSSNVERSRYFESLPVESPGRAALEICLFAMAFCTGMLAVTSRPIRQVSLNLRNQYQVVERIQGVAPLLLVPPILQAYAMGVGLLISRTDYIPAWNQPAILGLLGLAAPVVSCIAAVLVACARQHKTLVLASLVLLAYVFLNFAAASRELGVSLGFLVAAMSWRRSQKYRRSLNSAAFRSLVTLSGGSIMGVGLALALRDPDNQSNGLLPYVSRLADSPFLFLEGVSDVLGNFTTSVRLTGFVREQVPVVGHLYRSTTPPLSPQASSWSSIASEVRVRGVTPFNAIGELGQHSLLLLVFFAVVSGCALGALFDYRGASAPVVRLASRVIASPLCVSFFVVSLQYNLRVAANIVWLALVLFSLLRVVQFLGVTHAPRHPYAPAQVGP